MKRKTLNDDQVFELRERISEEVHKLVDRMTQGIDAIADEEIRQTLTEQFRFWRRC